MSTLDNDLCTICTGLQAQCNVSDATFNNTLDKFEFNVGQQLFILYGYNTNISTSYPTNYIFGVYHNSNDVINRINELCNYHVMRGFRKYCSNSGWTYFVNVIPIGNQKTELFTTGITL